MNIKFLLDTNIISESIKLQPNHIFLERFRRNLEESAIASVTWHELLYGLYRLPESRRKKILSDYLTQVIQDKMIILPYCHAAADRSFGKKRGDRTLGIEEVRSRGSPGICRGG